MAKSAENRQEADGHDTPVIGSDAMNFGSHLTTLHDCTVHGTKSGAELFLVEGDSASKAVCRVRDASFQAVLPMQGKPMNALKAQQAAVHLNALYRALIDAIGVQCGDDCKPDNSRYDRVILLFDPDADGIHIGVLMLMFFYRWMRPLLSAGKICVIRPPLYQITFPDSEQPLFAYTDSHCRRICDELERRGIGNVKRQFHRGLASMSATTLSINCVRPESRNINLLRTEDAEAAISIFAAQKPQ